MNGWLYNLTSSQPARFRASGLDAAHRVSRRVAAAVDAALEADPEVIAVEDRAFMDTRPTPCDGTARCRAGLHNHECPRSPRRR